MNVRKAAGPDGITGRVLRSCADQLAGLFTSIFNESLATSVVPTSFKKSVIIPVPKNSKPSCLNALKKVYHWIKVKIVRQLVTSNYFTFYQLKIFTLKIINYPLLSQSKKYL